MRKGAAVWYRLFSMPSGIDCVPRKRARAQLVPHAGSHVPIHACPLTIRPIQILPPTLHQ